MGPGISVSRDYHGGFCCCCLLFVVVVVVVVVVCLFVVVVVDVVDVIILLRFPKMGLFFFLFFLSGLQRQLLDERRLLPQCNYCALLFAEQFFAFDRA